MTGQKRPHVAVVGGGPAGLMAADVISAAGLAVTVFERMPSLGRKLLMAGRGGLNLTHGEPLPTFIGRYGAARVWLEGLIEAFPPDALRAFAHDLGEETFVGSSGRVFPRTMKASPLLRAWLARLARQGVEMRPRHTLVGFEGAHPHITGPDGAVIAVEADATVLALGGGSWPRLGSDGAWVDPLSRLGCRVVPLEAANARAEIAWSEHFRTRFAGAPLKRVAVTADDVRVPGELVIAATGLEGGPIYRLNPQIRSVLHASGHARLSIDLRPELSLEALTERLRRPRGKQSMSEWLRKAGGLVPAASGLLREGLGVALPQSPESLANAIKELPLDVTGLAGIERAISSAGGIARDEFDDRMMLRRVPGLFVAGEMLDWEAPTGGYLLQACMATGRAAGQGVLSFLAARGSAVAEVTGPPVPAHISGPATT